MVESQPILCIYFPQRYQVYLQNILQDFVFKILLIVSLVGNISTFGFKRTKKWVSANSFFLSFFLFFFFFFDVLVTENILVNWTFYL